MANLVIFLGGFLVGGLCIRWLMVLAEHRAIHARKPEKEYAPAARAILRYLKAHGTVNLAQVEQMLSVKAIYALRHLNHLERDGLIRLQGHKGEGAFYTLV